jgi:uncharacterized protein YbjT (DUF2867 family)
MEAAMKIVVIGGTGRIGSRVSANLRNAGHDVVAAAPSNGVNAVTGEGLAAALAGAQVVIDVANSPSFADDDVMHFFSAATANLIAAARKASIGHYVALSVVGTDRLQGSGYFRAKLVQEDAIAGSGIPYTIVRATQFFEFVGAIAGRDAAVTLPTAQMQPMVSDDVAIAVADAALGTPAHGVVEVAGPAAAPIADFVCALLRAEGDERVVTSDPATPYFGVSLNDDALLPGPGARIMPTRFEAWLAAQGGRS